jgi:hypothetical protein
MPEGAPRPSMLGISTTPEGERHPETSALRGSANPQDVTTRLSSDLSAKFPLLEVDIDCCTTSIGCELTDDRCVQMQEGGTGLRYTSPEKTEVEVFKLPEVAYARGCAYCPIYRTQRFQG